MHPAYRAAFAQSKPFLTDYRVEEGVLVTRHWTRDAFAGLTAHFADQLADFPVGAHLALAVSGNHAEDLACRLAAYGLGLIPITINWQADDAERVIHKLRSTNAAVILHDDHFPHPNVLQTWQTPLIHIHDAPGPQTAPRDIQTRSLDPSQPKLVIFTSGTTGQPKGVVHDEDSYVTNADTFAHFLNLVDRDFHMVVVNPLHHANATATTDWAMRNPRAQLHLFQRYTTNFWRELAHIAESTDAPIIAPMTARHFDFLDQLDRDGRLSLPAKRLRQALARVTFLLGSAPVGPTTVARLQHWTGRAPTVRFGSTETCLQVAGIPHHLSEAQRLEAFQRGWSHTNIGYYIGREHPRHTRIRIVASNDPSHPHYFQDVAPGQSGYIVTKGHNLMTSYLNDDTATTKVMHDGWYSGLQDIGYYLINPDDEGRDLYWMSRESAMLIRGGANYAYDQLAAELKAHLIATCNLDPDTIALAVVGLRATSEHEDDLCLTIEGAASDQQAAIKAALDQVPRKHLRVQHLAFADIPRNFKGAIKNNELVSRFKSTEQYR